MPTIVTASGRIQVPTTENVIVKVSGWVKYRKDGEIHHIAPHEVLRIEEADPDTQTGVGGNERPGSSVVYQAPYGKGV